MAVKLIIVFLTRAVIANELDLRNAVEVPTSITNKDPSLQTQNVGVNTLYNNQVTNQAPESHYDNVIELQKEEPSPCYSTAVLIPILNQLLSILMQEPSYETKVSRISTLLKEYLHNIIEKEGKDLKLNEGQNEASKDVLRTGLNEPIAKGHVKTKIVFKYDLPSINQPTCKDAFMKLMKSAYDAYMELAKNPMCQNAGILEDLIRKYYAIPQQNPNNNRVPNNIGNKGYSIYDILAPNQNIIHGLHQEPNKYIDDLNNPSGGLKPVTDAPHKDLVNLELPTNILEGLIPSKPTPNAYDVNGFGKTPNLVTPHNVDYNKLNVDPSGKPNDGGNFYMYNLYGNHPSKPANLPTQNGLIFPYANEGNLNPDNLKLSGNHWNLPPIGLNSDKNQSPIDSLLAILAKTPKGTNLEDKAPQFGNLPNYNLNQNVNNPHQYYQELTYQYQNPGNGLPNQIYNNLDLKVSPQYKDILNQYNQPFYKYVSNQYGIPYNKLSVAKPYAQNVHNYLSKLAMSPNLQQFLSVPNAFKLDPSINSGVIELTFVLKRATPLIYQPMYFVKFRIPYSTFLYNMQNLLLRNPQLKVNPLKLYQELIALSNVSDISPGLKGYKKEDILKLAYKNGELVTAKLLKDDNSLNDKLRLVQNLNAGIGAADIWKLASKASGIVNNNSSNIYNAVVRNGDKYSSVYDLSSTGIGFNYDPNTQIGQRRPTLINNVQSGGVLGIKTVQPTQIPSSLMNIKPNYSGIIPIGVSG